MHLTEGLGPRATDAAGEPCDTIDGPNLIHQNRTLDRVRLILKFDFESPHIPVACYRADKDQR